MNTPVLSVIVPTYNHEKYIRQAIESIIFQPKNFVYEILCVDDNSTDDTPRLLREIQNEYSNVDIRLFFNDTNKGVAQNIYSCFMEARGKYITLLEGDDYWELTDELMNSIDFLENNSSYSAISRGSKSIDEKSNEIIDSKVHIRNKNRETNIRNYFKGAPLEACIFYNFYKNNDEDFSIIYKSARMQAEMAIGFLIVEHCNIYNTGIAWEVKRTNRVAGASNYNSITKQMEVLEEYMKAYAILEEYRPQYDFFVRYKKTLIKWFWQFFYEKDWISVLTFCKYVKHGHRFEFWIDVILSSPAFFKKYISDKAKLLSMNK